MNKITFIYITLFALFSFVFNGNNAFSWDNKVTHRDLSEYAAVSSVLGKDKGDYLKNLGFDEGLKEELKCVETKRTIKKWLAEGAELEDTSNALFPLFGTTRSFNHFHNPLKPWSEAGLDDWVLFLHYTGQSSLLWAQDGANQQNFPERDWSWQKTREYYYLALTSATESNRQTNFAKTFRGLGHQMHLLQDTAVPDHVRNDAHPEDAIFGRDLFGTPYFETWAKEEFLLINSFAENPDFSDVPFNISYNNLVPTTQLFDAEQYNGTNPSASLTQGLAEYTNANFFSGDTIFAAERYTTDHRHYFPYPKKSSTDLQAYIDGTKPLETVIDEDGSEERGVWISKVEEDGETIEINHFVRPRWFTDEIYKIFGEGNSFYSTFYRDEKCHEDYAQKLIPRAVGYSAGLLDYFFRGSIEITLPNSAVYSLTDPATGFTRITLLAKNTTPNGEEMTDGSIELVVKYRLALEDPFRNYPPDYPFQAAEEFSYIVVPEANNTRSIPRDAPVELTFDLSQNPIPLYAIDVYLQIVYNGKLGLEDGAVAVGFKDISEPTPIDLFNDADRICMNGSFYVSGSPEAIALVDTNKNGIAEEWPVYPYDVRDIYYRFSTTSNPQNASPTEYHFYVPYLAAGNFLRALFILSDYKLNHSFYATPVKKDPSDPWSYLPWGDLTYSIAIKNQTDYIEDSEICAPLSAPCYIWWYPTFLSYRDVEMWDGVGFMSICHAYPLNSECSCYEGILRGCIKKTEGIIETGDGVEQELIKGTHPTNEF